MRNLCLRPSYLSDRKMWVDCGHCLACRKKKRGEWIMRIDHQFHASKHDALFITLTYNNRWLPISKTGAPTLLKRDAQKWLKRLRKRLNRPGLKYFLCGEYGSQLQRPHYHAIIIGMTMAPDDVKAITDTWNMCDDPVGYDIKPITSKKAIAYVAGYAGKKIGVHYGKRSIDQYGRSPEFQLTSSRLGLDYLLELAKEDPRIENEGKIYINGKPQILPRAYRRQLGITHEKYYDDTVKAGNELVEHMRKYYPEEIGLILCPKVRYEGRYTVGDYIVTDKFFEAVKKIRKFNNHNLETRFKRRGEWSKL